MCLLGFWWLLVLAYDLALSKIFGLLRDFGYNNKENWYPNSLEWVSRNPLELSF